jgi:hypothetical protein
MESHTKKYEKHVLVKTPRSMGAVTDFWRNIMPLSEKNGLH